MGVKSPPSGTLARWRAAASWRRICSAGSTTVAFGKAARKRVSICARRPRCSAASRVQSTSSAAVWTASAAAASQPAGRKAASAGALKRQRLRSGARPGAGLDRRVAPVPRLHQAQRHAERRFPALQVRRLVRRGMDARSPQGARPGRAACAARAAASRHRRRSSRGAGEFSRFARSLRCRSRRGSIHRSPAAGAGFPHAPRSRAPRRPRAPRARGASAFLSSTA